MQYRLLSKKTKLLKQDQIFQICKLKNTHWKYGLNSNLEWFKKHVKSEDVHNLLYYKSKLIGYTLLRLRTLNTTKSKNKFFYFDTLIIDRKFKKLKISNYLMNFNNEIIFKNNKISFLICENKLVKYYEKFGWKLMQNKSFLIVGHDFNTNGMCLNIKVSKNNKKYIFYFNK